MKHGQWDDCKGPLRHSWYVIDVERRSSFGTPVHYRCERCGTVRKDIYDRLGQLAARYYQYPKGYGDEGRVAQAEYRLRLLSKERSRKKEIAADRPGQPA